MHRQIIAINPAAFTAPSSSLCRVKSRHTTSCPLLRNQAAGDTIPNGCRPSSYVEISTIFIIQKYTRLLRSKYSGRDPTLARAASDNIRAIGGVDLP